MSVCRYRADFSQLRAANKVRIVGFVEKLGSRKSAFFDLEDPKPEELLYLLSLVPDHQRAFSYSHKDMLLNELVAHGWSGHNGRTILLFLDKEGSVWLDDGQHRLAAFFELLSKDPEARAGTVIRVCVTRDPEAYMSVDCGGRPRRAIDIAVRQSSTPISTGIRSAIEYEHFDFKKHTKLSPAVANDIHYDNPALLAFVKSLPKSGGGSSAKHCLAGIYAAAIRAWRVYPEDKVRVFFSALIRNQQTIDDKKVDQLVRALDALTKYQSQRAGGPGKVLAATIGMRSFVAWVEGKRLSVKELSPPAGDRGSRGLWPTTMELPLPIRQPPPNKKFTVRLKPSGTVTRATG